MIDGQPPDSEERGLASDFFADSAHLFRRPAMEAYLVGQASGGSEPRSQPRSWKRRLPRLGWARWSAAPVAAAEPGTPAVGRSRFRLWRKRIPLVHQTASTDCGAACLAMILRFHGRHVTLDEVREVTGFGRDGAGALSLLRAGRHFGLKVQGVRVEDVRDLNALPRGSILHWKFGHFLLLDRVARRGAEIIDPDFGRRRVDWDELDRAFTGVALCFEPWESFTPADGPPSATLKRMSRELLKPRMLIGILSLSLLAHLLGLGVPLMISALVDRVLPIGDGRLFTVLAAGGAAILLFKMLTLVVRSNLLLRLQSSIDLNATVAFVEHLMELPYEFFQRRSAADLSMRLNANTVVREILTTSTLSVPIDGLLILIYLGLLWAMSSMLALVALGLAGLRLLVFFVTRQAHRDLMAESLQRQTTLEAFQVQLLAGIETLKASGRESTAIEHWRGLFAEVVQANRRRGWLRVRVDSILEFLGGASPLVILFLSAHLVLEERSTLGEMFAANALATAFFVPFGKLVETAFQLQFLHAYLQRLNDVLEAPRELPDGNRRTAPPLTGRIDVENVTFRYSVWAPAVLRDVSITIPRGSCVAIVGPSGAGKSTLARLLIGLYRPESGRVMFDDNDLAGLELPSLRKQIGFVPQQPRFFSLSIRAILCHGDQSVPMDRVVEAGKLAQIHDDILSMPMGYETLLGDAASSFSGGQRQRLALARALVFRPQVLVLDEATSALDAILEQRVNAALALSGTTRVVIAHRLSSVQAADSIIVLDRGEVVESGTHDDLVSRGGLYAALSGQTREDGGVPSAASRVACSLDERSDAR